MPITKINVKLNNGTYQIVIGENILSSCNQLIKKVCPKTKKIALLIDKNVPTKFIKIISKSLKNYKVFKYTYSVNEKFKSINNVTNLIDKCLFNNFNRNDLILSVGGGILGDFSGFASSLIKRGINFINIPTTLLAQVDSSIGGKTGVNSKFGKNLIGSFYQPKLVISDVAILKSLPKREIVCGFAEILKHSLIKKNNFFNWLKKNSNEILQKNNFSLLKKAIIESCKIKIHFVTKDTHEESFRMILNFGHTFAHALEVKNNYSKTINHGEAVLMGMLMATKLSYLKKVCDLKTLKQVENIYKLNRLNFSFNKYFKKKDHNKIVDLMANDKKNNDNKINLILLKKIGQTTIPGKYKVSNLELKKAFSKII